MPNVLPPNRPAGGSCSSGTCGANNARREGMMMGLSPEDI
jgi:hypothetical protein